MKIPSLSKRSSHTTIAARTVILVTLLQGGVSAQTSPPTLNTQCTLSNGVVNGPFGGYVVSGSFSGPAGGVPTMSNITLNNSLYVYNFNGPVNGSGYTVPSQLPVTPCNILGCPPGGQPKLYAGLTIGIFGTSASLAFTDAGEPFNGSATLTCGPIPPPGSCAQAINGALSGPFTSSSSTNPSANGGKPLIYATFTPPGGLQNAATLCNVQSFDWVQMIIALPDPSPYCEAPPSSNFNPQPFCLQFAFSTAPFPIHLTGRSAPFHDPPSPVYNFFASGMWDGPSTNSPYPYYYDPKTSGFAFSLDKHTSPSGELSYSDLPSDQCILGPNGPSNAYLSGGILACAGSTTPPGSSIYFTTHLVGYPPGPNGPIDFGIGFDWKSNYNGTSGGVATTANIPGATDDGNGTGGVTVTNVSNTTNYNPSGSSMGSMPLEGSQVALTASGLAYSRVSRTFNGEVTITNISASAITGPFQIAFNSLTGGVTVANATGAFGGWSYITVPSVVGLSPGQFATVAVQFSNPSNKIINFIPLSYTGSFSN